MTDSEITYARAGGPPDDWPGLTIWDLETGLEVKDVTAVNTAEGWVDVLDRNAAGEFYTAPPDHDRVAVTRLSGRFDIRRPATDAREGG